MIYEKLLGIMKSDIVCKQNLYWTSRNTLPDCTDTYKYMLDIKPVITLIVSLYIQST